MKIATILLAALIAVFIRDIDTVLYLEQHGVYCYEDQRHGGKGGFTPGWVCLIESRKDLPRGK